MAIPYDPGKRLRKIAERKKRALTRYKRMACDGTERDYWRHRGRGEEPCAASKKGHALAARRRRKTGVRVNDVPANDLTDEMYRGGSDPFRQSTETHR